MIFEDLQSADFNPGEAQGLGNEISTRSLGLIVPLRGPIFLNHFIAEVLAGIQTCMIERNYHLTIYSHGAATGSLTRSEIEQSGRADGVIVVNTRLCSEQDMQDTVAQLQESSVPFVMVNGRPTGDDFSYFGVDEYQVGCTAGDFLIKAGHRRIAMLGGAQRSPNGERLLQGLFDSCRANKLAARIPLHEYTEYERGRIAQIVTEWMRSSRPPTAICCEDQSAAEVYETLRELGLSIPQDVAVLGRGDLAMAASLSPRLTTVRIPAMEIGRLAAEALIAKIEQENQAPTSTFLPCTVTVRESV